MKPIHLLTLIIVLMMGLSSCSDEQRALDFVSKEVVSEEELTDFLIKHSINEYKDVFWNNMLSYANSKASKGGLGLEIYLSKEFAHFDKELGWRWDHWTANRPANEYDSEKILSIIHQLIAENINSKLVDTTFDFNSISSPEWSEERMYNYILSKAVCKGYYCASQEVEQLGLEHNYDLIKKYEYDWAVLDDQSACIDEIVIWIIAKSRDKIKYKNYKLIDKQSSKVDENVFHVRYLLDPRLEIVFPVRKIGKTFVCDDYWIEGDIEQKD